MAGSLTTGRSFTKTPFIGGRSMSASGPAASGPSFMPRNGMADREELLRSGVKLSDMLQHRGSPGWSNLTDPRTGQRLSNDQAIAMRPQGGYGISGWNTSGVGPGTRGYRGSWRPNYGGGGGYNYGQGTGRPSARNSAEYYAQRDEATGNPLDNLFWSGPKGYALMQAAANEANAQEQRVMSQNKQSGFAPKAQANGSVSWVPDWGGESQPPFPQEMDIDEGAEEMQPIPSNQPSPSFLPGRLPRVAPGTVIGRTPSVTMRSPMQEAFQSVSEPITNVALRGSSFLHGAIGGARNSILNYSPFSLWNKFTTPRPVVR